MTSKKLNEFYSNMNHLQMVYTILGVLQLIVTALYSLLALPYLSALLVSIFKASIRLVELICCWRLCFTSKKKKKSERRSNGGLVESMPMRFKRLRVGSDEQSFDEDDEDSEMLNGGFNYRIEEHADDSFVESNGRRAFLRSGSFWLLFALFFLYGALFIDFLLFMNSYLISRLSSSNFNQIEIINKYCHYFFTQIKN